MREAIEMKLGIVKGDIYDAWECRNKETSVAMKIYDHFRWTM